MTNPRHHADSRRAAILATGLFATLLMTSCQDLSEIRYETDEVRVGTYFEEELCAGDLRWMDTFVRQIETDLDAVSDERVEIHLFHPEDPHQPRYCDGSACYDPEHERVFSSPQLLEHELVHAVMRRKGKPLDLLYNEGIPEAFSNRRLVFGNTLPSDNLERDRESLDGRTAGHFFRWLWEEHDRDALRRLARGAAFADAYGFTFEEAEAAYLEQAPWSYPRRWPCSAPPLASAGNHAWDETLTFACDDDETLTMFREDGYSDLHQPRTRRTIQVTNGGLFNFSGVGSIHILACQLEPVDHAPPESVMYPRAPDPAAFDEAWGGFEYPILSPVVQIELPPGTYEITVREPLSDDAVRLIITPALEGRRP